MSFNITDISTSLLGNIFLQDILALATFLGGYVALKQIIQNWRQQINEKNSNYANSESIEIVEEKASKDKKIIILLGILIIALIGLTLNLTWNNFQYAKEQKTIQEDKNIKEDAELVSKTIVISGWESPGDYIGYLTQIVGFYKRHETYFSSEYESYSTQLTFWQDYLNRARDENKEEFASKWNSEFADKNFQIFKDAFKFAKSDMYKTDYDAEKFAFHQLKKK